MTKDNIPNKTPLHVAFIMDGNRRWAKQRNLPTNFGHKKGLETLEKIISLCVKKGIHYLTFYAFSTENWQRSKKEVSNLLKLMGEAIEKKACKLQKRGARVKIIGRMDDLPSDLRKKFEELEKRTSKNKTINVAFAISYGGRAEIVDAVNKIKSKNISEKLISKNLYAPDFPDPDLIIRTGGSQRLSGFLLWQSAYSELYFSKVLWPDFNEVELEEALNFFSKQQRNFGK